MDKISVIIPIYKVEAYLRQCVDSIIHQTYRDLEIILIDDGSPDKCGEICDEYAAVDSRVRVVHKKNGGLTNAWNDGMAMAAGKWITFVDSDDWLDLDCYEKALGSIGKVEPDILQLGGYIEEIDAKSYPRKTLISAFLYENGDGREYLMARVLGWEYVKSERYKNIGYVWDKIYKTSFLRKTGIRFDPSIRAGLGCDALFNFEAYEKALTTQGILYGGYHHRRTADSGTLRYGPDQPKAVHYILEKLNTFNDNSINSELVRQGINAYAILHIASITQIYFFHPENKSIYRQVAKEFLEMKKMPYYHQAIYSGKNRFLSRKQNLMKFLLRSPLVWPWKLKADKRMK